MRRKMGAMDAPAPAAPSPMDEQEGAAGDSPAEESSEGPTAFLPKEMGGGKQWKPGDEIMLTVKAVDPETGELQVAYAPEMGDEPGEPTDSMSALDKAVPDDSMGGN